MAPTHTCGGWTGERGGGAATLPQLLTRNVNNAGPGPSPRSPKKGLIRLIRNFSRFVLQKIRVLKLSCLAFSEGPGGFRELREAGRNHFHLSWYLSVAVVTSYDLIRKLIILLIFSGGRFSLKALSRRNFGVLGPENSDSSSKTTYVVLFPG